MAHRSRFEDRLLSILDPKAARHGLSRMMVLASLLAAGAFLLPVAALEPSARAHEPPSRADDKGELRVGESSSVAPREEQQAFPSPSPSPTPTPRPRPQSEEGRDDEIVNERALTALMEELQDPELSVREQAVGILGRMRYAPALEPLIKILDDDDPDVREQVAWALGMLIGHQTSVTGHQPVIRH